MSSKEICYVCGHKMTTRRENRPFLGLPGTVLVDVPVHRCPSCGEEAVEIPQLDELHRTLALDVVEKQGRLTGDEIRFLRKVLDRSSADFARLVGASPVTVSRWEHGAQEIGAHADMLLRAIVLLKFRAGVADDELAQLARATVSSKAKSKERTPMRALKHGRQWERTKLKAA